MTEDSKLGWTDHTHNFWWDCDKVSTECNFCYIDGIMRREGREPFGDPMRTNPHRWQRQATEQKIRFRDFTCSMSDFLHPGADAWRPEGWGLIKKCDRLDWLVLTKRPELISERLPSDWGTGYPKVWLGVTCGARSSLPRLEILKMIPEQVRFVSAEPLLESIDFTPHLDGSFVWVITGCERAGVGKRREMNLDWVRDIDRQCRQANVAHFFMQRYEGTQISEDGMLDGKKHQKWPVHVN